MEFLITGFILGLMGSLHCAGMCGPIALSLPIQGNSLSKKVIGGSLYNTGRVLMYGIMGLLFGLIGQGFVFIGFQQWISIVIGISMIASVIIPALFHTIHISFASSFSNLVRSHIQSFFTMRTKTGIFMLGAVNALLPCGFVYLAIAGSIGTGNAIIGMFFMILFGIGTLPMMLTISIAGNLMSTKIRMTIQKKIPILVIIIGIFFILRGLSLGIPFLSPPIEKMNPQIQMENTSTTQGIQQSCCHAKK